MNRLLCSTALACGIVLFGVASGANAVTFTENFYNSGSNPNAPVFSTVAPTSFTPTFAQNVTGSIGGVERSPYETNTDGFTGTAYSVLAAGGHAGGSTATYNLLSGATSFQILWGSPDSYNHIQFWTGANGTGTQTTFSGTDLVCFGFGHNCNQLAWDVVTFSFTGIGSIVLIDDGDAAFEYGLNGVPSSTPLPGALWLFGTVVAGAAGASRLRRQRKAA
jgi:hypothetical protein